MGNKDQSAQMKVFCGVMEDSAYFAELLGDKIFWQNNGKIIYQCGKTGQASYVNNIFSFRDYLVDQLRELRQLND